MSPALRAAVPGPVVLGLGVALALGLVGVARAFKPPVPEGPAGLLAIQPNGLPAVGVTVWCGWVSSLPDRVASPGGRPGSKSIGAWLRGVTDAAGRLRFDGEPEECVLRGDGVDVLGATATRVAVVPSFRCESALVVVERRTEWLLSWYRRAKGFSRVRTASTASLASAVREVWLEHGERRHPHDRVRDCAIVVNDSRAADALSACAALTRPIVAGHADPIELFVSRETELPALDARVWSPEALCAWVATPLPRELVDALPYGVSCLPRPER